MIQQQRFALFVPSLRGGGAERSMLKLASGLVKRGYAVDLVLAQAVGPYLADVSPAVRVIDLKASRVLSSLPNLVRYLRQEKPHALLSAMNHANIVALWARRFISHSMRLIVSERVAVSHNVRHTTRRRSRLIPHLIKRFYPQADEIVAVSHGVADDLTEVSGIPRGEIQVIYNPIVTPELQAKTEAPLDHPWFQPGQPPVLLAAGRLRPQKGFGTLIDAFAELRRMREARLLILGEGPERPFLESLIAKHNLEQAVSLPGFVANPYPYMKRAALFVLSSGWEGLPGVLIEAMYCGLPLVSTDCPSGPREILQDGKYGQLVPVGDMPALAHALWCGLEGQTPQPEPESWRPFTLDHVIEQYLNVLVGR